MRDISAKCSWICTALIIVLAAFAVTGASAADFEGDNGPCHETPGNAALLQCPTAYVGQQYEVEIATDPDSGCYPYIRIVVVNSALPAGLSITPAGVISGVPVGAGFTRFWLWNHDLTPDQGGPSWCAFDDVSQREFSIPVDPGLAIDNETIPQSSLGQPYSQALTAKKIVTLNPVVGDEVQATWSLQSGSLPPGVSLSPQGLLSGTPTTEGSWGFTVMAQNGGPFDTQAYTLSVRQPVAVKSPFGAASGPGAEVGVRLAKTVTATGGSGTYSWSLGSGTLPAGVKLDTAKGTISGTPQAAGNFAFALTATDSEGRVASVNAALSVASKLTVKTQRLKLAKLARPYTAKLATSGGARPVTWRLVSGKLPRGVLFAKTEGSLVGTPRRTGNFRVVVEARDALGARARKTLELTVTS